MSTVSRLQILSEEGEYFTDCIEIIAAILNTYNQNWYYSVLINIYNCYVLNVYVNIIFNIYAMFANFTLYMSSKTVLISFKNRFWKSITDIINHF